MCKAFLFCVTLERTSQRSPGLAEQPPGRGEPQSGARDDDGQADTTPGGA